jgi:formylglycine-generating enzyme required for sulfatase activity
MMRRAALAAVLVAAAALAACARRETARLADDPPDPPCLRGLSEPQAAPSIAGMAFIPGGRFVMGAGPLRAEEGPPRPVEVGGFWIDRTDVTNAQFARFVAATGYVTLAERPLDPRAFPGLTPAQRRPAGIVFVGDSAPAGGDPGRWWRVSPGADWRHPKGPASTIAGRGTLPVVQVAYEDALAYARWLGRDLPTEAEWEYAARGGRPPARYVWGDQPFDPRRPQANVWQGVFPALDTGEDGYAARASPVGCFPANPFGLYDMAGDVWQWTKDIYRPGLDAPASDEAQGPRRHVIKGGSFLCSPDYCFRYRPAAREAGPDDSGENHIGFRTVLRPQGAREPKTRPAPDA